MDRKLVASMIFLVIVGSTAAYFLIFSNVSSEGEIARIPDGDHSLTLVFNPPWKALARHLTIKCEKCGQERLLSVFDVYSAGNLSIRPKMKTTRMGMISELIRSLGGKPEEELIRHMFSQPHRTYCSPNEEDQYNILSQA